MYIYIHISTAKVGLDLSDAFFRMLREAARRRDGRLHVLIRFIYA